MGRLAGNGEAALNRSVHGFASFTWKHWGVRWHVTTNCIKPAIIDVPTVVCDYEPASSASLKAGESLEPDFEIGSTRPRGHAFLLLP